MLKTKAFANLCETTKKTIIYYDQIGLLKPAARQGINRFYKPKQVLIFQKITMLKSFGLSLAKIKKILYQDTALKKLFIETRFQLANQKKTLEKRITKVDEFIDSLEKCQSLIAPKLKTIKAYQIYGLEKTGRYVDIKHHQEELFRKIRYNPSKNIGITIFFDPYYSPEQARMITGAVIKDKKPKNIDGVSIIKVPPYKVVSYTHIGPYSYLSFIWQFLKNYVKNNKLKLHPAVARREFYIVGGLSEKNEDNFVTELQIPIL